MAKRLLVIDDDAHGYRVISSDSQFSNLGLVYPKASGTTLNLSEKIIPEQTVAFMQEIVKKTLSDTASYAHRLKGSNLKQTCANIWRFLHDNIQYKVEEGEQLRRPSRSLKDRKTGIDCDCFAIFASSILSNLKIPHKIRIAGYGGVGFQHVYIAVQDGATEIIIDPVLHEFNVEKQPTIKKDYPIMATQYLAGPGNANNTAILFAQHGEGILNKLVQTRHELDAYDYAWDQTGSMSRGDSQKMVAMLDNLIRVFGTPEFDTLVEQYSNQGLSGATNPVANFFGGIKNAVNNVKDAINNNPAVQNIKDKVNDAIHVINKFNPILAAGRGLFLLAMKHIEGLAKLFLNHVERKTSYGLFILKVWNFGGGDENRLISALKEGVMNGYGNEMGIIGATVAATAGAPAATMLCTILVKGLTTNAIKIVGDGIVTVLDNATTPRPVYVTNTTATPRPPTPPVPNIKPASSTTKPITATTTKPVNNTGIVAPAPPSGFVKNLKGLGDLDIDKLTDEAGNGQDKSAVQLLFAKIWDIVQKIFKSKGVQSIVATTVAAAVTNTDNTNPAANVPTDGGSAYMPDGNYTPDANDPNTNAQRTADEQAKADTQKKYIIIGGIVVAVIIAGVVYAYNTGAFSGTGEEKALPIKGF